ncbi:cytochrome d ubiquinol oxidase subunit II [Rhodoplanes sp. TEM]|uniref:Cytochrome d ubiquinol oxidase subunit II n=1 Tax=Rhodoplanes tepidamans TaxID=200616 RepID=A0ABT5JIR5_RHOTP|nr:MULTISPECIES: cytochrome d ubiquinol oxidase subunit II [Rhodoplanes]MDC7789482.1 cytochrome d ubiquinol oxidase subunit II [Rhodoplanes tepidamans]MDC7986112.1 cytochrome d ubiquinol oxidase subunit II [Rhodoplanes sp. TEM]
MDLDLPMIWAVVLAIAVALYVVMDGFDLGIGILFPFAETERQRDQMMSSIAPFWDGNETWLVLGGGGLLVAFPRAYSIIMPALYLPVIFMLLALVLRGVSFEFRNPHGNTTALWSVGFFVGSALAAFFQGIILGGFIQGLTVVNGEFAGGPFEWATPFAALCGLGVMAGYALLGATWLIMKTEGPVAERAREQARGLLLLVMAFMAAVSLWTPLAFERIATRWFSAPNIYVLWIVPVVTAGVALTVWRTTDRHDFVPFVGTIALFLLGFLGLAISTFPYAVPPVLTIWDAAAAPSSQAFMLVGTVILLPIILGYVAFVYWLFRGKVREGDSYH